MAAAGTDTTAARVAPPVECRVCGRPVRTARARAARLGEGCRRKAKARWRRRFQQLPLVPLAAAAGRMDPARQRQREALIELDEVTADLATRTDQLERDVQEIAKRPEPQQPHPYEPAETVTDWAGRDITPCRVCQRPRKHSIHRRPRRPRTPRQDPRRALVADAWRERERAMLGDHD